MNYMYWIGLLIGLALPFIMLCIYYTQIVCKNLAYLEKYDITDDPNGIKKEIPSDLQKFDIITLVLFIFLIYAFVAILFTIKRSTFGDYIYTSLIGLILFIISIFIYILYVYVPFFNTNKDNVEMVNNKPESLKLFIDQQTTVSSISTNQYEVDNVRKVFLHTFITIYIFALLFFIIAKKSSNGFLNGLFSSFAILILPLLWVFNFVFGIQYFYIYPMIYIIIRFFRYILMSILYIASEKSSGIKNNFSSDLIDQLDNFKNYSPSWGLIGVDEFKLFLNVLGYENVFSKLIIPDDDTKNISQNKFISSGFLGFIVEKFAKGDSNNSGIMYSIILFVVTIVISMIILGSIKAFS